MRTLEPRELRQLDEGYVACLWQIQGWKAGLVTPDLMFYAVKLRDIFKITKIYFHVKFTVLVHIAIGCH